MGRSKRQQNVRNGLDFDTCLGDQINVFYRTIRRLVRYLRVNRRYQVGVAI